MPRASGRERASRSNLVTTRVSPARQAARAARPGAGTGDAGQAMIEVDPVGDNAEPGERVALRGEVLFVGRDPGVADQQPSHPDRVPV